MVSLAERIKQLEVQEQAVRAQIQGCESELGRLEDNRVELENRLWSILGAITALEEIRKCLVYVSENKGDVEKN